MKIKKRYIFGGIALLVLMLAAAFFIFRNRASRTETILTEKVQKGDVSLTVSAAGHVVSRIRQFVTSRTSAKVVNVLVNTGDVINKGQVMAYLDSAELQAAYKEAQYSLAAAIYRRESLKESSSTQNEIKQAQQDINAAQVRLDLAKQNLENDKIIAPFDGEVTEVNIHVEDLVREGDEAFTLETSHDVEGRLSVNEIDITKLKLEQTADADLDAIGGIRKAKIYSIVNDALKSSEVADYTVKIRFEDTKDLRPGMSINADIQVDSHKNVLFISSAAIKQMNGKSYVRVVTGTENGQIKYEEKEVTVGINNNSTAEVISGLEEGQSVVISLDTRSRSLLGGN